MGWGNLDHRALHHLFRVDEVLGFWFHCDSLALPGRAAWPLGARDLSAEAVAESRYGISDKGSSADNNQGEHEKRYCSKDHPRNERQEMHVVLLLSAAPQGAKGRPPVNVKVLPSTD
jgi:hypothetical protein